MLIKLRERRIENVEASWEVLLIIGWLRVIRIVNLNCLYFKEIN